MSDDLEAAVAEGATLVRVGTAIFGARGDARPTADRASATRIGAVQPSPADDARPACPSPPAGAVPPRGRRSCAALARGRGGDRLARRRGHGRGPGCEAVRDKPAPFWALESLLREYPISQRRGPGADAAGRGAAARARHRDGDRADRRPARPRRFRRAPAPTAGPHPASLWPACRPAPSRCRRSFLPDAERETRPAPASGRADRRGGHGARHPAARPPVRARPLDRRSAAAKRPRRAASKPRCVFSYDMLGEGARTERDARALPRRLPATPSRAIAGGARRRRPEARPTASRSSCRALFSRYEEAQRERVFAELLPRVWQLIELAARGRPEPDHRCRGERPARALARRLRGPGRAHRRHATRSGAASAWRCRPTRRASLAVVDEVARIGRAARPALHGAPGQGRLLGRRDQARAGAGPRPATRCSPRRRTPTSAYLACARRADRPCRRDLSAVRDPQRRHHRRDRADGAATAARRSRCSACTAWARRSTARCGGRCRLCASTRRSASTATCWPTSCAGCSRTAPTPRSCTSSPTRGRRRGAARLAARRADAASPLPLPVDLYGAARAPQFARRRPRRRRPSASRWSAARRGDARRAGRRGGAADVDAADRRALQAGFAAWNATPACGERAAVLRARRRRARGAAARVLRPARGRGPQDDGRLRSPRSARRSTSAATTPMRPSALRRRRCPGRPARATSCACTAAASSSASAPGTSRSPSSPARWRRRSSPATRWSPSRPSRRPPWPRASSRCCTRPACRPMRWPCCTAPGETVGAALVADARIGRRLLHRLDAGGADDQPRAGGQDGPIVPLIAETGGVNAMIVDPSALPEQVVDAVVQSAFRSAGQRCSALRLLCVHESIADAVLEMLRGAMAELRVGDPARLRDRRRPGDRRRGRWRTWLRAGRAPARRSAGSSAKRRSAHAGSRPLTSSRRCAFELARHRRRRATRSSARCCTSCAGAATPTR